MRNVAATCLTGRRRFIEPMPHAACNKDGLPVLPLNLVADFGGGALYLATGMLAAMLEAGKSGTGQVVDAAMIDGVASMSTMFQGLLAAGMWQEKRGANLLDGSAPFYRSYATRDGKAVVVGAMGTVPPPSSWWNGEFRTERFDRSQRVRWSQQRSAA